VKKEESMKVELSCQELDSLIHLAKQILADAFKLLDKLNLLAEKLSNEEETPKTKIQD